MIDRVITEQTCDTDFRHGHDITGISCDGTIRRAIEGPFDEVMWCLEHCMSSETPRFCPQGVIYQRKGDCRMEPRLMLPIEAK